MNKLLSLVLLCLIFHRAALLSIAIESFSFDKVVLAGFRSFGCLVFNLIFPNKLSSVILSKSASSLDAATCYFIVSSLIVRVLVGIDFILHIFILDERLQNFSPIKILEDKYCKIYLSF